MNLKYYIIGYFLMLSLIYRAKVISHWKLFSLSKNTIIKNDYMEFFMQSLEDMNSMTSSIFIASPFPPIKPLLSKNKAKKRIALLTFCYSILLLILIILPIVFLFDEKSI